MSIIVPAYDEEKRIEKSLLRMDEYLNAQSYSAEIIIVDDGSKDETLTKLKNIADNDKNVKVISFSRHFGHQVAITAGMDGARAPGQVVVLIDANLQNPPEVVPEMTEKWK